MSAAQKEKKFKKPGKQKKSSETPDETSQSAYQSFLAPDTPGQMPPPPPFYSSHHQAPSKVPIPRLRRDSGGQSITASMSADKNRIAHACEPCRQRKTKCSGERPKCKHCEDFKLQCAYMDGKRDRARKELGSMAGKLDEYEQLLKELSLQVDRNSRQRITKALEGEPFLEADGISESPLSPYQSDSTSTQPNRVTDGSTDSYGEDYANARAGSTGSLDKIDEDYNRDAAARATGYHGKNSEVTWLQRLRQQSDLDDDEQQEAVPNPATEVRRDSSSQDTPLSSGFKPVSSSTYHCDDVSISITDMQVDPYKTPPKHIADLFFQSYLDTVHPTFPIIGKTTFVGQYKDYFAMQVTPNDNWLAILNLIFAIGARYAHLIKAEWRGDERDHLIYFTRARILGFNADSILTHAELQSVQISGLMAFYLMTINQINRSWAISGIAIRHASTLGLNLRNDSRDVKDFSKEIRYRVWWALCFLERHLAVMTGRSTSFSEADCSTPLPLPVDESSIVDNPVLRRLSSHNSEPNESVMSTHSSVHSYEYSTSSAESHSPISQRPTSIHRSEKELPPSIGLYFLHQTKLSICTHQVLSRLYRVVDEEKSWAETQSTMVELEAKLEKWRQELPLAFDFTKRIRDQQWVRQRKSLGFFYYSTLIIINRPCLCRMDRKTPNASEKAKEFDQATAVKCVHAAIDMLKLLPNEPNPVGMYTQCPWWCLVHHLVEAAVVCMLELSFRADHMPNEVNEVFESADKAVQWLLSMSSGDLAASRAGRLCNELLRKVSPKVGKHVDEAKYPQQPLDDPMQGLQSYNTHVSPAVSGMLAYQTSAAFQPPIFTRYDQMIHQEQLPPNPSHMAMTDSYGNLFPTASEMEAMRFEHLSAQGPFPDQDRSQQHWYPDGGGAGG